MLVDLAPYIVAGIAAVWVPWLTFRYAIRQDQRRWWREQRAAVYVDMLVESYAELQYLLYEITRLRMGDDDPRRSPTICGWGRWNERGWGLGEPRSPAAR